MDEMKTWNDGKFAGYYDEHGRKVVTHEFGSDESLDRHSVEVQNGAGYYDSDGTFHRSD